MDKFGIELFGYNKKQVSQFVFDVVKRTEKWVERLESSDKERKALEEQIIQYQENEKKLKLALENSIRNQEIAKKNSLIDAERIIQEAKDNADRIILDSINRSEELERKIEKLEHDLRKFKNQLRTIAEQQIDIVEEIEDLEKR